MQKILFVCSQNRLRSPTAEHLFSTWPELETDSAGISQDATILLSVEQIQWADIIFVMEKVHRQKLSQKFACYLYGKRVVCLDIPDNYDYMQPELIKLLERKVSQFLR